MTDPERQQAVLHYGTVDTFYPIYRGGLKHGST